MFKKKSLLLLLAVTLGSSSCFADSYFNSSWNYVPVCNQQQNNYSHKINDLLKKLNVTSGAERQTVVMSIIDQYYLEGGAISAYSYWISLLGGSKDNNPLSSTDLKKMINKKLDTNPNNEFYNFILGNFYQSQGLNEDALSCYDKVLKINPNNTLVNTQLGKLYQSAGEYNKAIKVYDGILNRYPYEYQVRSMRAKCFAELGMKDKAKAEYKNILQIEPSDHYAIRGYYNLLKDATPSSEILVEFLPQYKTKPIDADAYSLLAKKLTQSWELDGAETNYKLAISLDPKNLVRYTDLVDLYKISNNNKSTRDVLIAAKPIFVNDMNTIDKLNSILVKTSSDPVKDAKNIINSDIFGDSVSYYRCIEPKNADVYVKIAAEIFKVGNSDEAIVELNKALKLNPKDPDIYYNFALIQQSKNDYIAAKNYIKKSLAYDPNNKDYLTFLDNIQPNVTAQLVDNALSCINSDNKKAADIINEIFKDGQINASAYRTRGLLRYVMGNNDAALQDLLISYEMEKTNPSTCYILGLVYDSTDSKSALKYYKESLANSTDLTSDAAVNSKTRIDELSKIVPVSNVVPANTATTPEKTK